MPLIPTKLHLMLELESLFSKYWLGKGATVYMLSMYMSTRDLQQLFHTFVIFMGCHLNEFDKIPFKCIIK